MFDILIFTQHPSSYAPNRFTAEAKRKKLKAKIIGYSKLSKSLPLGKYIILREPDPENKYFKMRDRILKHYLSTKSIILNSHSYLKISVLDKSKQEKEFIKARIPHIKSENYKNLKYPFIAKSILGSHGDHVYKINDKNQFNKIVRTYGINNLIFQKFQNSGFDLRVIVIDFKAIGLMKRTPRKGEFLSNFSKGGNVKEYCGKDVTKIKKIAEKVAKHFRLNYVGVDLMKGNDKNWKVLEVNRACQFKGFEKALKINVSKIVIDFLLSNKKSRV